MDSIEMQPVGVVQGGRTEPVDDDWGASEATIVLDAARFSPDVVAGLEDFSHLEVVYVFHLVEPEAVNLGARHPRGRSDWPAVGIFAQRAKMRPNRIGVTICELVVVDGLELRVRGLDAIEGAPVLDVKPYMTEFGPRGDVREPAWARELMTNYWKA